MIGAERFLRDQNLSFVEPEFWRQQEIDKELVREVGKDEVFLEIVQEQAADNSSPSSEDAHKMDFSLTTLAPGKGWQQ